MGGNSDLERRIMRLEQAIPHVRQRIIKLGQLNGANLQAIRMIRESVGDTNPPVATDSACGVTLYTNMTVTDSEYGVWSMVWRHRGADLIAPNGELSYTTGAPAAWQACRVVTYASISTPVMYTVFPVNSLTAGQYAIYLDWLRASGSTPATGTCGSTFNANNGATLIAPTCGPPWNVEFISTSLPVHTGTVTFTFSQ